MRDEWWGNVCVWFGEEGGNDPGWVLPYLGMVGRFCGDGPGFGDFQSDWVPILYLNTIRLTPSFCRKICLSLSHLVPNVGLFFHQNVLFNRFKAFCVNFLFDFQSNWLPFSLILNLFDPSFSQNLRSDWVQFFFRMLNLATENLKKYHPLPCLWHTFQSKWWEEWRNSCHRAHGILMEY